MAYGVVRTDLLDGTDVRAALVSIEYFVNDSGYVATDIENGNVLKVDELLSGEREIYRGIDPAVDDSLRDIVLVASPEVMYDESKRGLDNFINKAGYPARGYRLRPGNIFSVTADCLDDNTSDGLAVGSIIELQAKTKLSAVDSATQGSTVVGKIIHVETAGKYTYYAILVA